MLRTEVLAIRLNRTALSEMINLTQIITIPARTRVCFFAPARSQATG